MGGFFFFFSPAPSLPLCVAILSRQFPGSLSSGGRAFMSAKILFRRPFVAPSAILRRNSRNPLIPNLLQFHPPNQPQPPINQLYTPISPISPIPPIHPIKPNVPCVAVPQQYKSHRAQAISLTLRSVGGLYGPQQSSYPTKSQLGNSNMRCKHFLSHWPLTISF